MKVVMAMLVLKAMATAGITAFDGGGVERNGHDMTFIVFEGGDVENVMFVSEASGPPDWAMLAGAHRRRRP